MCRKLIHLFYFQAVVLGLCGRASAVDNHWLGTAGDNQWTNAANGHLYLGRAGAATLNINGGTFAADDNIELGRLATGYGEINLAGGTLQASTLKLGAGTLSVVYEKGATTVTAAPEQPAVVPMSVFPADSLVAQERKV